MTKNTLMKKNESVKNFILTISQMKRLLILFAAIFIFTPLAMQAQPANPSGVIAASPSICDGPTSNSTTLTAQGVVGAVYWFTSTCGGLGDEFTTGNPITVSPTTTTVYYAKNFSGGLLSNDCASATVTVRPVFTSGSILNAGETICYNGDPAMISNSVVSSGGDGAIVYQWQSSTDGIIYSDISGAESSSYNPPSNLTVTTWYRRQAHDGTCELSFLSSTGVWKVTVYDDFSAGAILSIGETICYAGEPNIIGNSVSSSGGNGVYTYQWQSSTDNIQFDEISGANSDTYTPPVGLTTSTWYRRQAHDGLCNTTFENSTNTWLVTVLNDFNPGSILTTGETISDGGDPAEIGNLVLASGGDEAIYYQWQSTTAIPGTPFADIVGATSDSYNPPAGLMATTWYRRLAYDGTCNIIPEVSVGQWKVTVNDHAAGTIAADQTICYDGIANLTEISPVTVLGTVTYQWQDSTSVSNFTNILGATGIDYTTSALQTDTWYRRISTSSVSGNNISNTIKISIVPVPIITVQPQSITICSGSTNMLSVTATGGTPSLNYLWQTSADGVSGWSTVGGNSATYTTTSLIQSTYYRVIVSATGIGCNSVTSDVVRVSVPRIVTEPVGNTICAGGSHTMSVIIDGGSSTIEYQWQYTDFDCASGWNDITGANANTLTVSSLPITDTRYFRCNISVKSSPDCPILTTLCVPVQVLPDIAIITQPVGAAICNGSTHTMSVAATGGVSTQYQWQQLNGATWNNVSAGGSGETTNEYTTAALSTTKYRVVMSSTSSGCASAISSEVTVEVNTAPSITLAPIDFTICEGSTYTLAPVTVANTTNILWTSTGSGSFNDNSVLNPIYTPSSADIIDGSVVLTITATSADPCPAATASMTLTINKNAIVNASEDATICELSTYSLSSASASNYSSLLWTSSGTGVFDNDALLAPVYTPSNVDIAAGSVVLTLTAQGNSPCNTSADAMTLYINKQALVNAGADATICQTSDYTLSSASVSFNTSVLWTTSGTGTFSNPAALKPIYTPSAADITAGSVSLTITAQPITSCLPTSDNMTLTIKRQAAVNAGVDATICRGTTHTLSTSSASNYTSILWSTSGTGSFSSTSALNPIYTPSNADITAGSVILTLTAQSAAPCVVVSDQMVLTISKQAAVDAGVNATICQNSDYYLNTATASNYTTIKWTTSGTGYFDNETALRPIYTPSVADIADGSVILTIIAWSATPCDIASDNMTLIINKQGVVNAGVDATICQASNYTLSSATASNYTSIAWSTSGTGNFDNVASLNAIYTPSAADISSGNVVLTLTAQSDAPCVVVSDQMNLTIIHQVVADAGVDATICEGSTYTLSTAIETHATSLLWTTSGTGSFNSISVINPIYTPSAADILNGSVILTLKAISSLPCAESITEMRLTINKQAIVYAGSDATICETSTFTIADATSSYATSLLWTTSGDGTFMVNSIQNPIYTPGTADIANGHVTLKLTAQSAATCLVARDSMVLNINKQATANAGVDASITENVSYTLSTSVVTNGASILWTTSGTGTFNNATIAQPVYTPSQNDIDDGSVVLTLTVASASPCASVVDQMTLTIVHLANLSITKTVNNANPVIGNVVYTITIKNNGPSIAENVVVNDALPVGLTFVSETNTVGNWSAPNLTIGNMNVGATEVLTITAALDPNLVNGTLIQNTASITSNTMDPDMSDNTSSVIIIVNAKSELSITSISESNPVIAGDTLTYTITVKNNGFSDAQNVVVTDNLPSETSFISATPSVGNWNTQTWNIGTLADGFEATLKIVTLVKTNVPHGTTIGNTASVTTTSYDPILTNNVAKEFTFVNARADLMITKTANASVIVAGENVTYTITVKNNGLSDAQEVVVTDILPPSLTLISATPSTGTWTNPEWTIGTIAFNAQETIKIVAKVSSGVLTDSVITNTATVTSITLDSIVANNTSTTTITITNFADLEITKNAEDNMIIAGSQFNYTITVKNNGSAAAYNIVIKDELPQELVFVSVSSNGVFTADSNMVIWTWPVLANNESITFNLRVQLKREIVGDNIVTNKASVSSVTSDLNMANNTVFEKIRVEALLLPFIPEGFSPNEDGQNDVFVITGLERYPDHKFTVLNRWGIKVYEAINYNNDWDGTAMFGVKVDGNKLPDGTYFYIFDTGVPGQEVIKGSIYLSR
ncbi:MAG: gliding motility-associated C-terminal domain-containing protein [Bacteroidota bacterium]